MIVVDASVAVKWFISEAGEEAAADILASREHLVAPELIHLEVAGAIIRRFREGHLSEKRAREGTQAWEATLERRVIQLVSDAELFAQSVEMAFLIRHTLSDCLYLALAKRLDVQVVTADGPMFDRGNQHYSKVTFLPGVKRN